MGFYYGYCIFYGCILTKDEYLKLTISANYVHFFNDRVVIAVPGTYLELNGCFQYDEDEFTSRKIKWDDLKRVRSDIKETIFDVNDDYIQISKPYNRYFCEIMTSTYDDNIDISKVFLLV